MASTWILRYFGRKSFRSLANLSFERQLSRELRREGSILWGAAKNVSKIIIIESHWRRGWRRRRRRWGGGWSHVRHTNVRVNVVNGAPRKQVRVERAVGRSFPVYSWAHEAGLAGGGRNRGFVGCHGSGALNQRANRWEEQSRAKDQRYTYIHI